MDKAYRVHYDPAEIRSGSPLLVAHYNYRRTDQAYVLTKKAPIWSAETHEYVYVFSVPHMTEALWRDCRDEALELGMREIRPHDEHRVSMITALIVCSTAETPALEELVRCRRRKDFLWGFHGWMEFRAACVVLDSQEVHVNRAARDLEEFLRKNLNHVVTTNEETQS